MVHGYCLGAGFELALACDVRVSTPDSQFGLPEVKVGIPSVIDAALLPRYVGLGLAKEMILTGDLYPADRRSRAVGVFMLGLPMGLMLAYFTVGRIAEAFDSWSTRRSRPPAPINASSPARR